MRKLMVVCMILLSFMLMAGSAFAGTARNNCGCGLGTVLWAGNADDSVVSQTLQATTNGTFANQLFGITSGTLECEQPSKIAASERLMEFASRNMDNLARDIAKGQGESLDTLAELMEIPAAGRPEFAAQLQSHFGNIFVIGTENAATILDRIATTIN